MSDQDQAKERAGRHAASYVTDGMRVGLGTGSTVHWTIVDTRCEVGPGARVGAADARGIDRSEEVTILGMDVAQLLGGVLFVENVFAIPGIGTLAVQAIGALDIPVIMGTVLFSAFLVVSANLVVDIAYRWMDPRIRSAT